MVTIKQIFTLRRIVLFLCLALYAKVWVSCFIFFHSIPPASQNPRCGMPDFAMFIFIIIFSLIYFLVFLTLSLTGKGQAKKDVMVMLAVSSIPFYIALIDFIV